jgi:hypothetical protein
MGEGTVQVQPDAGGKRVRTRERTVSGLTVEEQYVIPLDSDRVLAARFFADAGLMTVLATADLTLIGRWYLFNPAASAVVLAVRRIEFTSQHSTALVTASAPRIAIRTFTATGTGSGAAIVPAKHDTTDAAQAAYFSLASTGLTLTDGNIAKCFFPTVALTAVGIAGPSEDDWIPDPAYPLILRAGQGIYCTQLDNGTTADTRKFLTSVCWDEFTQP